MEFKQHLKTVWNSTSGCLCLCNLNSILLEQKQWCTHCNIKQNGVQKQNTWFNQSRRHICLCSYHMSTVTDSFNLTFQVSEILRHPLLHIMCPMQYQAKGYTKNKTLGSTSSDATYVYVRITCQQQQILFISPFKCLRFWAIHWFIMCSCCCINSKVRKECFKQ